VLAAGRLRTVFEAGREAERAQRADALLIAAADCRPRLVRHAEDLPFHLHYAPVRAGRRRFCSLRCANQVNVANHRRRRPAA
jgi:hypothetical protein